MPEDLMHFHLENGRLAAYLDDRLPAAERAEVEAHLADCAECRAEVVAASRVRRSLSRRPRWVMAVPLAAAAVLAFVFFRLPSPSTEGRDAVLRDGAEPVAAVTVVLPVGTVVEPESLTFVWGSVVSGVSYRVVLTDSSGGAVWSAVTSDTSARPPATVHLIRSRYYWYVDALLADGRSVTSGAREFRTTP